MFGVVDGGIVLVLLVSPFLAGLLAGIFRELPALRPETESQRTPRSVYQQGLRLAILPGMVLFLVLTAISLVVSVAIGYAGGRPSATFFLLQGSAIIFIIGVSVGGLTIAGAVTGVSYRHRAS